MASERLRGFACQSHKDAKTQRCFISEGPVEIRERLGEAALVAAGRLPTTLRNAVVRNCLAESEDHGDLGD